MHCISDIVGNRFLSFDSCVYEVRRYLLNDTDTSDKELQFRVYEARQQRRTILLTLRSIISQSSAKGKHFWFATVKAVASVSSLPP